MAENLVQCGHVELNGISVLPWGGGGGGRYQITCFHIKTFICKERDILNYFIICIVQNVRYRVGNACYVFLFQFAFKLQNHSIKYFINTQVKTFLNFVVTPCNFIIASCKLSKNQVENRILSNCFKIFSQIQFHIEMVSRLIYNIHIYNTYQSLIWNEGYSTKNYPEG